MTGVDFNHICDFIHNFILYIQIQTSFYKISISYLHSFLLHFQITFHKHEYKKTKKQRNPN